MAFIEKHGGARLALGTGGKVQMVRPDCRYPKTTIAVYDARAELAHVIEDLRDAGK